MKTKSIFASKTFWMNAIIMVLSIIVLIDNSFLEVIGLGEIGVEKVMTIVAIVTTVLNKILRFLTKSAVSVMGTGTEGK